MLATKKARAKKLNARGISKSRSNFLRKDIARFEKHIQDLENGISPGIISFVVPDVLVYTVYPAPATVVKFVGTSKVVGGQIQSNLLFLDETGSRLGIAKGVKLAKEGSGFTFSAGGSAKVKLVKTSKNTFKLTNIKKIKSFMGGENTLTKPQLFKLKKTLDLLKKGKSSGKINVIKTNVKGLVQSGSGTTINVKGNTFFKTSGKTKAVNLDDFSSLSQILTQNEISLIAGKTLSTSGSQATFTGLIKGLKQYKKGFSVSPSQQVQYTKAIQKLASTMASSLAKNPVAISKTNAIALAGNRIKSDLKFKVVSQSLKTPIVQRATIGRPTTSLKTKTKTTGSVKTTPKSSKTFPKSRGKNRSKSGQASKTDSASKTETKTKPASKTSPSSRTGSRMARGSKQVSKQKTVSPFARVPMVRPRPKTSFKPVTIKLKKKATRKPVKRKKKLKRGYDSFVKKRKVVNTKTLPFSKERAFDLLAYYLDKRPQTRGLTIKSLERTPKATLMRELKKAPKGYFRRNRKKFILRQLKKGRETYEMIEKKKYQRDSKLEKRKVVKRKSPSKRKRRTTKKRK
jgi:hypothetical protein